MVDGPNSKFIIEAESVKTNAVVEIGEMIECVTLFTLIRENMVLALGVI